MEELIKYCEKAIKENLMMYFNFLAKNIIKNKDEQIITQL